jgi:hypothetical protein
VPCFQVRGSVYKLDNIGWDGLGEPICRFGGGGGCVRHGLLLSVQVQRKRPAAGEPFVWGHLSLVFLGSLVGRSNARRIGGADGTGVMSGIGRRAGARGLGSILRVRLAGRRRIAPGSNKEGADALTSYRHG